MKWQIENDLQKDIYRMVKETKLLDSDALQIQNWAIRNDKDPIEELLKAENGNLTNIIIKYLQEKYDIKRKAGSL